jgi:DNA-binding protein WhiA
VLAPGGLRKGNRYLVRVEKDGRAWPRPAWWTATGGRCGLPRQVVAGTTCDRGSAWRGAFLAHGSLTEPGRSMSSR